MPKARRVSAVVGAFALTASAAVVSAGTAVSASAATTATHASKAQGSLVPGVLHAGHATSQPPTTAECETAFQVACYEPGQIQTAYNLQPLFQRGVTGRGQTIVIVDSFGSPTIRNDLKVFDQTFHLPAPPSFKIIQPAGAVPPYDPTNSDMVGWAGETTLDVQYAHTMAPGANILLVETPVSETEGVTGFPQIVEAENYVVNHHLGDVISQSFGATEQTFPNKATLESLRSAYENAAAHHVTVTAATGDSGAANVEVWTETTYYLYPMAELAAERPAGHRRGRHPAAPERDRAAHLAGHRLERHLQQGRPSSSSSVTAGPNPLAGSGGKSIFFSRPVLPGRREERRRQQPRRAGHLDERRPATARSTPTTATAASRRAGTRPAAPARPPRCSRAWWPWPTRSPVTRSA